jgi:two-component system, chemotaxis family, sensor kinase CheA
LLALDRELAADSLRLGLISDSLQDNIRRVRLVPFEVHVSLLQRAVRDIARDLHKEVGLQITGAAIELDKRVLESIKDPILHILRNAVDHGIEFPTEREHNGKPREGMIILAISQRGGNVLILIADDGRGIDVAAVRQSARRIMSEAEIDALSDADVLSLIMLPGFSTRTQVTSISGRGIGLDVVRQNVEALQGHIDIDSQRGIGTTFRLTLPVSLSTLRCMLARIGEETYAIPTAAIEQIIAIDALDEEARFSAGGREMLTIDGRAVGLIALADVLDRPGGGMAHYALVLSAGERRMAFLVDDLVTEQEMVVKQLNREMAYVRHVSGATLLGSGEVVIILNVADLVKTAQSPAGARPAGQRQPSPPPPQARTILVVDDSITTRTLEKNILEAAGFEVATATNGLEALEVLERVRCALVVADIEMPYMDGFELTSRIRHSERFGQLPVILVTSLELPEYREQGFQVGADAYMVKGSFNQGELLYTVRQLIG